MVSSNEFVHYVNKIIMNTIELLYTAEGQSAALMLAVLLLLVYIRKSY